MPLREPLKSPLGYILEGLLGVTDQWKGLLNHVWEAVMPKAEKCKEKTEREYTDVGRYMDEVKVAKRCFWFISLGQGWGYRVFTLNYHYIKKGETVKAEDFT